MPYVFLFSQNFFLFLKSVFFFSIKVLDIEALGLSNIVRRLLPMSTFHLIRQLPSQLLQSFIEQLVVLTCDFAEGAATEETVSFIYWSFDTICKFF